MKIIIALLLILSFIFPLFYLIIWMFEPLWYRTIFGKQPNIKLSYEDFMKYYNLAPQKYEIDNIWKHLVAYENQCCSHIYIGFNIIDTYKVVYTLKTIEKQEEITKKQEQKNREMKEYLESVQKDIDNLLNESEQQINEAKEISNTISPYAQSCIDNESLVYDWKIVDGRLIRFVVE
ncbi:MAG: hypothetical protein IKY94_15810 [Lachnospiraceae bacterium]|nr:hypothetical protein [Lachnospiraceae bacterium]